jgi:hypothetical protein
MIILSLSLSSSYKHLTDLIVGGGSAGQPPAGLSCFAGQGAGEGDVSDDATSPNFYTFFFFNEK